jgi:hypothetical protein
MLKSFITIVLVQLSIFSYSQLPTADWAKQLEGVGGDYMVTDSTGNIYIMGAFNGTRDFDPGPGNTSLTCVSSWYDSFLSKYDSDGNFLWVKQWDFELGEQDNFDFMVDVSGNIYMAGTYYDDEDFDPGNATHILTGNGAFLLKLNSSGDFVFAESLILGSLIDKLSIHVMSYGEITVGGTYGGTATFISGEVKTSAGRDNFLFKLNNVGTYQWLKCWGGPVADDLYSHDRDRWGNIYIAGSFISSTDLDPGPATVSYNSNGNRDFVFSKLNPNGELTWARVIGGSNNEWAFHVRTDYAGNVYVSGNFGSDTVDFDASPTQSFELINTTSTAGLFTAKYSNNGEFVWANSMEMIDPGTLGAAFHVDRLTVDTYGNSFLSGYFKGVLDFDPGVGTSTLSSNGDYASYIRKLDPSGDLSYAFTVGNAASSAPLCMGEGNSFYAIGGFTGTVDFQPGSGVFSANAVQASQYILKMNECSNGSVEIASECQSYIWPANNISYTTSGTYSYTLSNDEGCDSVVILDLTINPNTSVTQNSSTISAELSGATYQWINCDLENSPIFGAVSQSFSPIVNGNYAVIITQNGCSDTSSCVTISTLDLNEAMENMNLIIFPNPAHESVTLFSEQDLGDYSIKVLDLNGKILPVNIISNNSTKIIEINISEFLNGIYFVNLISEKENRHLKFIKN